MTQQSIPVQPGETAVTAALRTLATVAGWCVTATTNGQHAAASLHYSGRAVDLASFDGPGVDTLQLLQINEAVRQLLPIGLISELIYAGPGGICVYAGRVVDGLAIYGAQVMAEHHDHVHLGVVPTFTYNSPAEVDVALATIVCLTPTPSGQGYWLCSSTGAVYSFGDAQYHGGLEQDETGNFTAVGLPK